MVLDGDVGFCEVGDGWGECGVVFDFYGFGVGFLYEVLVGVEDVFEFVVGFVEGDVGGDEGVGFCVGDGGCVVVDYVECYGYGCVEVE